MGRLLPWQRVSSQVVAGESSATLELFPMRWHRVGSLHDLAHREKIALVQELEQLHPGRRSALAIASDRMLL
jgi:hypothetical protein